MCEQLAFFASLMSGIIVVLVGVGGLFHVDYFCFCRITAKWLFFFLCHKGPLFFHVSD